MVQENSNMKDFFKKYGLILIILALFVVFLFLLLKPANISADVKKLVINYMNNNHIVLNENEEKAFTFASLNYKLGSKCYEGGIVIVKKTNNENNYKFLYNCNNKNSEDLDKYLSENPNNKLKLLGSNPLFISTNINYIDPGYLINEGSVQISGQVEKNEGLYLIKYIYTNNEIVEEATRLVFVTKKSFQSTPIIKLNGNYVQTLKKGSSYEELGYEAYDYKDGNLTNRVEISNNVLSDKLGTYTIEYSVKNSDNLIAKVVRTVKVVENLSDLNVTYTLDKEGITNKDVVITLTATGDGFSYLLNPDGETINERKYSYTAKTNDTYTFLYRKRDGTILEKVVEIKNIDKTKPTLSCVATITDGKMVINAKATDASGISKYIYIVDNKTINESMNTAISIASTSENVKVTVYDMAGNMTSSNCTIDDQTKTFTSGFFKDLSYNGMKYVLYVSKNLQVNKKAPIVIFLHGSGERGTSVSGLLQSYVAFTAKMQAGTLENAIYVAPLCNCGSGGWSDKLITLKNLIDYLVSQYNIDQNKIAITGHSLGGIGVYSMIAEYPNFFSVGVPLSGRSSTNPTKFLGTKIRAYHGSADGSISYADGKRIIDAIKNAGGDAEMVTLNGEGHNIDEIVYNDMDAIQFMLKQTK